MGILTLENTGYTATIDTLGAKLLSFKEPNNIERIFQCHDTDEYSQSIFYPAPFFAENQQPYNILENVELSIVDRFGSVAIISFTGKNTDLNMNFIFTIKYMLEPGALSITYNIVNVDMCPMRYCIGTNLNFSYNVNPNQSYLLEFEKIELPTTKSAKNLLDIWKNSITLPRLDLLHGKDKLTLEPNIFENGNIYLENPLSRYVRAYNKSKNYGMQVCFKDFQSVGFYLHYGTNENSYMNISPYTSYDERSGSILDKNFLFLDSNANRLHTTKILFY